MLAARGHVFVACRPSQWVARTQQSDNLRKAPILCVGKSVRPVTFEFDADRKIVAAFPVKHAGGAGVPGALIGADELHYLASAPDQQVR